MKPGFIFLLHDGASYHTSATVKKFIEEHAKRLTVYQLPAYSPDFNPIGKIWKRIKKDETHLQYFPTFDSLKQKVNEALSNFVKKSKELLFLNSIKKWRLHKSFKIKPKYFSEKL